MAKTVRWHQYWLGSPLNRDAAVIPLMRLLREPSAAQLQGIDFTGDVKELCDDYAKTNSWIDGCPEPKPDVPSEGELAAPDKQVEPDPAG